MTNEEFHKTVKELAEAWCDRRNYRALRSLLGAWPMVSGLTDEWETMLAALKRVRSIARDDLTEAELYKVDALVIHVQDVLER